MLVVVLFLLLFSFGVKCDELATLILARGGSKGIHLKNLQKVGGVSLLTRAVHTGKLAFLDNIVVSTDHPLIAVEALKSGASVFHRSYLTASDWAPSIWGAQEFLTKQPKADILVLLQPTSPFTRSSHIRLGLEKLKKGPYDCVFSVKRSFALRWQDNKSALKPLNFDITSRPRRQSWNGELLETGAFYITRKNLIDQGLFQNHNCTFVEVSFIESLDIDTYSDLRLADLLVKSNSI